MTQGALAQHIRPLLQSCNTAIQSCLYTPRPGEHIESISCAWNPELLSLVKLSFFYDVLFVCTTLHSGSEGTLGLYRHAFSP